MASPPPVELEADSLDNLLRGHRALVDEDLAESLVRALLLDRERAKLDKKKKAKAKTTSTEKDW